jgi:homoserine kinase
VIVHVPASSANLGPGFDALGVALSLHLELALEPGEHRTLCDDAHPAVKAFRSVGGVGSVWVRCPIPSSRGLGFSGAARVAGLVAGFASQGGSDFDLEDVRLDVLHRATALEGHADNAAASLYGGVVVTAAGLAVPLPLGFDPTVVMWVPGFKTSTDESRGKIRRDLRFEDAVFNIGRTALLVAALAAGRTDALRDATQDRLHQDLRFALAPQCRVALERALEAGAWCGWLSGSGPAVAALCPWTDAETVANALPTDDGASTLVLRIDHAGAVIED